MNSLRQRHEEVKKRKIVQPGCWLSLVTLGFANLAANTKRSEEEWQWVVRMEDCLFTLLKAANM